MNLSEREWMVLRALWETGGAELGTLVQQLQATHAAYMCPSIANRVRRNRTLFSAMPP